MYGIYIHYPFCIHKCSYCDFYSIERLRDKNRFVDALLKEIDLRFISNDIKNIEIDTIFFGGGTPSLMSGESLEKILEQLNRHVHFSPDCEFTLEMNPGTVDLKFLQQYKSLGVNRISFGVQSFVPEELKFLERIHSPDEVFKSVAAARDTGFQNINIDLMFALPPQTFDTWKFTIDRALSLNTEHISAYSLIYEPGTPLYAEYESGKIVPKSDHTDTDYYNYLVAELSSAGFQQYEVSNYAKNGNMCRHNLKYWHSEEYFAFGPSAHGFIGKRRYWNYRSNEKYFALTENNKIPEEGFEVLSLKDLIFERLFLELRADGLDLQKFKNDFGFNLLEKCGKELHLMQENKLLNFDNQKIALSSKGYFIGDSITLKLADIVFSKKSDK